MSGKQDADPTSLGLFENISFGCVKKKGEERNGCYQGTEMGWDGGGEEK